MSLYALGGGPLIGDRLMRFAYLDESGLNRSDKYIVVAGPIVNADKHWRLLENYLFRLANQVVPPKQREGFCFHAKELHQGKAWEPHEPYPHTRQREVLRTVCEIPNRFGLPVAVGYVQRHEVEASLPGEKQHDITVIGQSVAASNCAAHIELYMRDKGDPEEVATIVYENNDNARRLIKKVHNIFRSQALTNAAEDLMGDDLSGVLPFKRIVETAYFAAKSDTSLLQVADACAFAARRRMCGIDSDGYFSLLEPALIRHPAFFGASYYSVFSPERSS
jgi:hypothetical protein